MNIPVTEPRDELEKLLCSINPFKRIFSSKRLILLIRVKHVKNTVTYNNLSRTMAESQNTKIDCYITRKCY